METQNESTKTASEGAAEDITDTQRRYYLRELRFPPALERAFREDYDRKVFPGMRAGLFLLLMLLVLQSVSALAGFQGPALSHGPLLPGWISSAAILVLLLASLHRRFSGVWQPAVVITFCILAWQLLTSVINLRPPPTVTGEAALGSFRANTLLLNELLIVIVGFALTRLRFVWSAVGILTLATLTLLIAIRTAAIPLSLLEFMGGTRIFVMPSMTALMFVSYMQERSARGEFLANSQLDRERADERRKRERTEGMLHVLSQAIGGIVHDLGNPLTAVRTGAETLRFLGKEGEPDKDMGREILDIISDGALMLDYLRLSLLEQVRVLEGKPIPIEKETVSVRPLIEASTHYQKPKFTSGRTVSAVGEDLEIQADGMKLITVFMNLLGNALKYSDGEIQIVWRTDHDVFLCAILDQGWSSAGISRRQADQLFVAFGRLVAHQDVEGTGLGLLSAQKIVEAHGGEIFIEGHMDGSPATNRFSTAQGTYPSMLAAGFYTAFVVTCPLPAVRAGEGRGEAPPPQFWGAGEDRPVGAAYSI